METPPPPPNNNNDDDKDNSCSSGMGSQNEDGRSAVESHDVFGGKQTRKEGSTSSTSHMSCRL